MLLIVEKSVFQKSHERSCFEDLAAIFSPVFSFYKECNSTLVLTLDQIGPQS